MAAHVQAFGPAEVDIAGSLHQPLPLDHALTVLPVPALGQVCLEHRCRHLLDLQEQGIVGIASLEQDDERPGADAANAAVLAVTRPAVSLPYGRLRLITHP